MKKYFILTSLLALTACATGGGNGGALSPEESNRAVTGMNSFVVIGGSNPTVNVRAASLQSDGGTRYDLENVTFKTIPTSGVISKLKFHTDPNGKIESIEYVDAKEIMKEHPGSDVTVGPMKRDGDTNKFIEHREYKGQTVNIPTEYVSYAQELGLKYSDFGVLRTDIASTGIPEAQVWGVMETPFVGGYDVKNVDNTKMADLAKGGDMVFAGLAKGRVSYHDWDAGIDGADVALKGGLSDEHATLTFKQDGTQILAADFKNWAQIEAVQSANGKNNQFNVIKNYTEPESHYYVDTGSSGKHDMVMQTGYYGDNNVPTEAVGLVQYQYSWGKPHLVGSREDVEHHLNVDLGFGGKIEK